jgi:hypothetical protein
MAAVEGPVRFDGAVLAAADPHFAAQATIISRVCLLLGVAVGVGGLASAVAGLHRA